MESAPEIIAKQKLRGYNRRVKKGIVIKIYNSKSRKVTSGETDVLSGECGDDDEERN